MNYYYKYRNVRYMRLKTVPNVSGAVIAVVAILLGLLVGVLFGG